MIDSKYLLSHVDPTKLEKFELPEVCFLGRSNAGKSTLINRITNRKLLAHVSKTPGKTKQFNLFEMSLEKNKFLLCDLPGFGYAKFSREEREQWRAKIIEYLSSRKNLKLAFLLLDSKRVPEEDELFLQDYLFELGIHLIIIATKVDRLNQSEKSKCIKALASGFRLNITDIIQTGTNSNPQPIIDRIKTLILE